jgi:hypothetical protein
MVCETVLPEPAEYPLRLTEEEVAVQVKMLPCTSEERAIAVTSPEQRTCEGGMAFTAGSGYTVTVKGTSDPVHPFSSGVTVYVTVSVCVPELFKVWEMTGPEPSEKPETNGEEGMAVQEKLVSGMLAVSPIAVVPPEQKLVSVSGLVTAGSGFTVTR